MMQKPVKLLKPWHMGTHLRVLRESFSMNTNMAGFRCFSKIFALDEISLSIERVICICNLIEEGIDVGFSR